MNNISFDMGNEATGWNGKVVMVQPISGAFDFADGINAQDGLYTVLVRGKENGDTVDDSRVISACSRCLNPYREADYRAMMEVAVSDDLEIIVSNTTDAGIAYDPSCKADDMPPASFPRCSMPAGLPASRASSCSPASSSTITARSCCAS